MAHRWKFAKVVMSLGAALAFEGDAVPERQMPPALAGSPPVMLWAWEEPEDLRGIDPRQSGVALLAGRIFLDDALHQIPRRQRILVPPGVWAEAVVRIEVVPGFADSEDLRRDTAQELLRTANLPGIRSLQIDFDATESQRPFYAEVLRRVRVGLPADMGLSMTALVSWCSVEGGWLRNLPVDSAVPMYFRLGKHVGHWSVREPLCRGSLGLATDELETAPALSADRVYLFAPRPWTADQIFQINAAQIPVSPKGAL
jgi:hypothetical protein